MSVLISMDNKRRAGEVAFWREALTEYFRFPVEIPSPPDYDRKQDTALTRYGFLPMFLPAISEDRFPDGALRPNLNGSGIVSDVIEPMPLQGRWVAVETIDKLERDEEHTRENEYLKDALMAEIGIESRLNHPYSGRHEGDDVVEDFLPKVAEKLGFAVDRVTVPSLEEWNLIAHLFNWLRDNRGFSDLPDLGSANIWERCRNAYDSDEGLVVGHRERGGLSAVSRMRRAGCLDNIGFRVLVVL